jgi:uncharacterized membrane protein YkoI
MKHFTRRFLSDVPYQSLMKILYRFILSITVLMASFSSQAIANLELSPSYYYQISNQQDEISEQAAAAIAQQKINGRVLAIRRVDNFYRIKILSNHSTVHIVVVNAINGKIMSSH